MLVNSSEPDKLTEHKAMGSYEGTLVTPSPFDAYLDARIEDRNHFEALVPRIYELGGSLPRSMIDFHNVSACPPAFVPADPTNIRDMLQVLVEAERCAVRGYSEICNMTFGKDHRTSTTCCFQATGASRPTCANVPAPGEGKVGGARACSR
jgi:hypothetical protein